MRRLLMTCLVGLCGAGLLPLEALAASSSFRRGDATTDGKVDLTDVIGLLAHLFQGGAAPTCLDAADANGDGKLDVTDGVFLLAYLFQGGSPPPSPGPDSCGPAPSISIGCDSYPPCAGAPPSITAGPSADPSAVSDGQAASLQVTATGTGSEVLTFAWTQVSPDSPAGTFADPTASATTWTAPAVAATTTFVLRVTVTGSGGSVPGDVPVTVNHANQPPQITKEAAAAPGTTLPGEKVKLTVTAVDPEGDKLTYAWTQIDPPTPTGTFTGKTASTATATWASPPLAADEVFTLQVSVTDGNSAPVTSTVQVTVNLPTFKKDVQPIFVNNCASCHTGRSPNLTTGKVYASLVNVPSSGCSNLKWVLPGDPNKSAIIKKITGTTCGSRMPEGNIGFFDTNANLLIRIKSWILAGANND